MTSRAAIAKAKPGGCHGFALRGGRDMRICRPTRSKRCAMANPFQFLQQTRSEIAKVVWPSRREVLVTTAMVFLLAVVFAIFFFFVDWLIRNGLELILTVFG
jgi:preprotein translocase subunit SecE